MSAKVTEDRLKPKRPLVSDEASTIDAEKLNGVGTVLSDAHSDSRIKKMFDGIADSTVNGRVLRGRNLMHALQESGLQKSDPRLRTFVSRLEDFGGSGAELNLSDFSAIISSNESLISRALTQQLTVPDFPAFKKGLHEIFESCRHYESGNIATYIPPLSRVNPNLYAACLCTVDGQVVLLGSFQCF